MAWPGRTCSPNVRAEVGMARPDQQPLSRPGAREANRRDAESARTPLLGDIRRDTESEREPLRRDAESAPPRRGAESALTLLYGEIRRDAESTREPFRRDAESARQLLYSEMLNSAQASDPHVHTHTHTHMHAQ